jgi:hypothetical protein
MLIDTAHRPATCWRDAEPANRSLPVNDVLFANARTVDMRSAFP